MIEGVIFDLWNTIIRSSGPRLVSRIGTLISDLGKTACSEDVVTDYLRAAGCLHTMTLIEDVADDLWRTLVDKPPPQKFRELVTAETEDFCRTAEFLPGAEHALEEIRQAGLRISVVSNASTASLEVVKNLDVGRMFDEVWISCKSGYLKPDPRAFIVVSDSWGVDPKNVCVVGDKLATDILGARLAGMQCLWLAPRMDTAPAIVDSSIAAVVRSLAEVAGLIKQI